MGQVCNKFISFLTYDPRQCLSEQTPPGVVGLWLSLSLTTSGMQELKNVGVYQVNSALNPTRISATCCAAYIMCAYSIFMHFLVRFSSYLPQGSQVSHLCQWSIVNVGKFPGEIRHCNLNNCKLCASILKKQHMMMTFMLWQIGRPHVALCNLCVPDWAVRS